MTKLLFVALVAGCTGCGAMSNGPTADTSSKDQADITALENRFVTAFNAKDTNTIMSLYVPDQSLIVFDTTPPRQYTGWNAYKQDFEGFFAAFPGQVSMVLTDLDITAGGNVAFSHSIQRTTATDKKGKPFVITARVTDGYKKINGQWLISHEHVSVPVDIDTMKPILDSK